MADKPHLGNGHGKANGNGRGKNGNGHATAMRLAGKVAIITGAGRGIGHATSLKFGHEGAKVVACDINADQAQQAAQDVIGAGARRWVARSMSGIRQASRAW